MFLLGTLALFQSMILPGALILKRLNFKGSFIQRLSYTVGLSLVATFLGIFALTLLGLYKQVVVLILFALQVAGLVWLYRQEFDKPIVLTLTQTLNQILHSLDNLVLPILEDETQSFRKFVQSIFNLLFIILTISALWWAFKLMLNNLGSIFNAWDAINSWNQWALTWASGQVPTYTHDYPQLIPANWSLTYIFISNTKVQFFAKALMLPFTFLILILFIDLGSQTKKSGFLVGAVLTYLLLKKFLLPQLTNGYVDIAVSFFATLTIYSMVKLLITEDESQKPILLVLTAVFAGGAAMIKQSGLYIFLLYFPLIYMGILRPFYNGQIGKFLKPLIWAGVVATLLALPWYVFKFIAFQIGLDRPQVQTLIQVSSDTYNGAPLVTQILTALEQFDKYLWLFALILLGLVFLPALYRWLILLFVLPYPLIWAYIASYDTRNLSIWLPTFGIIAGLVVEELLFRITSLIERFNVARLKNYLFPVIFLGALLVINYALPASKLTAQQEKRQMQSFSPQKNELIYKIVAKEGPDVRILTNYPINYLPGLENVKVNFGYRDYDDFLYRLQDPAITYLLLPRVIDPSISEYIEQKLMSGDYELVFENKEWLYYRMIHIVRR